MITKRDITIVGAVKILDGLFLGDKFAAQDLEFLMSNKINNVINCCGGQIDNLWVNFGVNYLTFNWSQKCTERILDRNDVVMKQIYPYVEECVSNSESILIHSVTGMNRSVLVLAAYLMKKYHWCLRKSLEFIKARKTTLEIKSDILEQLVKYESFLHSKVIKAPSFNWDEKRYWHKDITQKLSTVDNLENEEFMLRNTHLNSLPVVQLPEKVVPRTRNKVVKWADKGLDIKTQLEEVHEKQRYRKAKRINPVTAHVGVSSGDLRSAIKFPSSMKSDGCDIKGNSQQYQKDVSESMTIRTFEVEEDSKESSVTFPKTNTSNVANTDEILPLHEVISLTTLHEYSDGSSKDSKLPNNSDEDPPRHQKKDQRVETVENVDFYQKFHQPLSPKFSMKTKIREEVQSLVSNFTNKEGKDASTSKVQGRHKKQASEGSFRIKDHKRKNLNHKMRRSKQSRGLTNSHDFQSNLNFSDHEKSPNQNKGVKYTPKSHGATKYQQSKGTIIFNPTIINSITIGLMSNGSPPINISSENRQDNSKVSTQLGTSRLRKTRLKNRRVPSTRTDGDDHLMPSSRMQSLVRPSNSLRRTRRELDSNLILVLGRDSFKNDKASQLESSSKEDSKLVNFSKRTKIIKSKRQHSLNSLNTKNYRAKANNPPVQNSHGNGSSWFNCMCGINPCRSA
ncbi:unnamed protein product [Moneuplotes crassus]|uniref:Tyrosine-protein phosphatase domain-containing protein n=1 Tax=Euplotes crassus TaxID=5936 RepID=A0AAD1Y393_EUPCR|nr:unnamed protein product [Moneuplotes crassus]